MNVKTWLMFYIVREKDSAGGDRGGKRITLWLLLVQYWCFIGPYRDFLPACYKVRINSVFLPSLAQH